MSSKRTGIFNAGRAENPYEDRDGPAEVPQQATAAVMAARKIKQGRVFRRGPNVVSSRPPQFQAFPVDAIPGVPHVDFTQDPQAAATQDPQPAAPVHSQKAWPVVESADGRVRLAPAPAQTTEAPPTSSQPAQIATSQATAATAEPATAEPTTATNTAPQPQTIQSAEGQQSSTSFGAPSGQPSFSFGASAPAPATGNSASNPFAFSTPSFGQNTGGSGQGTTSSFPPAQASTSSNMFASSSFPAFGGPNANSNSTFNPQPPRSDFSFTASGNNPFGAPPTNGADTTAFSGSVFQFGASQSQPAATSATLNNTTSAPSSGGLFAQSATPSSTAFGGFSSETPNNSITSTSNIFGASATPANTSNNIFGQSTGPSNTSIGGSSALAQTNTSTTATNNMFDTTSISAPTGNLFGSISNPMPSNTFAFNSPQTASTSSMPFTGMPAATTPISSHFAGVIPQAPVDVSRSGPNFSYYPVGSLHYNAFAGRITKPERKLMPLSQMKLNPSQSLRLFTPQPKSASYNGYLRDNRKDFFGMLGRPDLSLKFENAQKAEQARQRALQSPFAPDAFTDEAMWRLIDEKNARKAALRPTLPPPLEPFADSATASPTAKSAPPATNNPFSTPAKPLPPTQQPPAASTLANPTEHATTVAPTLKAAGPARSNPFERISRSPSPEKQQSSAVPNPNTLKTTAQPATPQASLLESASLFTTPTQGHAPLNQQPLSTSVATSEKPSLMFSSPQSATMTKTPKAPSVPNIPKAHVPSQWTEPFVKDKSGAPNLDGQNKQLAQLSAELAQLNENYKASLLNLAPMGDWSALSKWHYTQSMEITKKIIAAKKLHAIALGVTGNESTLSTKRKIEEHAPRENEVSTPAKKPRGNDGTAPAFNFSSPSQTPKATPPTKDQSRTSSMFGNILSNPARSTPAGTAAQGPEQRDSPQSQSPFKTSASTSGPPATEIPKPPTAAFSTTAADNEPPKSGFQVPAFGTSSGGSSFFSQFASHAKTREQLTAERKQKAMPAEYDFDTDDSDEDEEIKARKKKWSVEWDREEAARLEKEKKALQTASGFNALVETSNSAPKSPFTFAKAAENASTSVFSSRVSSPAPSASASVFNPASAAPSPGSNIFGHLSSGQSSNNQGNSSDDDDDQEGEQTGAFQTTEQSHVEDTTDPGDSASSISKRKHGDSDNESDETLEETMRRKKQAGASQKSLFSRTTNSDGSPLTTADINAKIEAESATPMSNGLSQTPQNKFQFFDFANAGSKTAPPKQSFAGDQTFKPGNQIKFGTPAADSKSTIPSFTFKPASPAPANPTPKPNTFSFLNASAGPSAPASVTSSVFSSRAVTPASDATDNEQEEENKAPQLDLSELTEQERADHDILFHTDSTIAKHQVDKKWVSCGHGQLWILQRKDNKKSIVRVRSKGGNVDVNYFILPSIQTKVVGGSGKQVSAVRPGSGEGTPVSAIIFALRTPELAQEFSSVYNNNLG